MLKLKTPAQWAEHKTHGEWADHHMKVVMLLIAVAVFCSYPMGVLVLDGIAAARHAKTAAAAPPTAPVDGSGVVLSRNDTTGILSIQHAGVPKFSLAAGVTAFHAPPVILERAQVGDQVVFSLAREGDNYELTRLQIPAFTDRTYPR